MRWPARPPVAHACHRSALCRVAALICPADGLAPPFQCRPRPCAGFVVSV